MNETARAVLMTDARMRRRQAGQLRVALAECEEERADNATRADRLEWQADQCEEAADYAAWKGGRDERNL